MAPSPARYWRLPGYLERLWYVAAAGLPDLHHISLRLELSGAHEPDELRRAITTVAERHSALRLQFALDTEGVVCWMGPKPRLCWLVSAAEPGPVQGHPAASALEPGGVEVLDGPLLCASLALVGAEKSVLTLTSHQIVADARSMRILAEDLMNELRHLRGEQVTRLRSTGGFEDALLPGPVAPRLVQIGRQPARPPGGGDHGGSVSHAGPPGHEVSVVLPATEVDAVRLCAREHSTTPFTIISAAFGRALSGTRYDLHRDVGLLVSRRDMRRFSRTFGSFAELVPVSFEIPDECQDAEAVGLMRTRLEQLGSAGATAVSAGRLRKLPVMVSMVRDARARLKPPEGIGAAYVRSQRPMAETDIHLFVYDRGATLEFVVVFDAGAVSEPYVATLLRRFSAELRSLTASGSATPVRRQRSASFLRGAALPMVPAFHHLGTAVWELDLGLRRMAMQGCRVDDRVVSDAGTGVAFGLVVSAGGVVVELVAPLRADAPCLGPLTRQGEGPYHMCWQVDDINEALSRLAHLGVRFEMLDDQMPSPLFVGAAVRFAIVEGCGLVELLESRAPKQGLLQPRLGRTQHIVIKSSALSHAERFLAALGYAERQTPEGGWFRAGDTHLVYLQPTTARSDGVYSLMESASGLPAQWLREQSEVDPGGHPVTSLWSRVELHDAVPPEGGES